MSTDNVTYAAAGGTTPEAGAPDAYAGSYDTTEGRIYTVAGGDWDTITAAPEGMKDRIVVNMGPQHPSTHGVLRLILEIDGETVTEARCGIGYLHTGIEKECEVKTWQQVVPLTDRTDYLANLSNNLGYVLAVELKSATGTVTPSQAATAGKLRALGHGYSVVRSIQQLGEEITRAGILLTPNWQFVAARHDAELAAIAPAKKRLAAPKAKPTLSQIARGNRFSLAGAKGGK